MALKLIVAGTDGSAESLRAVEWAVREAALRKTALRIVAVPALPPGMSRHQPEGRPDTVADVAHKTYLRALGSAADCAAELEPGVVLDTALLSGPPRRLSRRLLLTPRCWLSALAVPGPPRPLSLARSADMPQPIPNVRSW